MLARDPQPLGAAARFEERIAILTDRAAQQVARDLVVIDDQDGIARLPGRLRAARRRIVARNDRAKRGAHAELALECDPAAEQLAQRAGQRQAQARALHALLVRVFDLRERREE